MNETPYVGISAFELSVWFWGIVYLIIILGIPFYFGYKEISSFWANPMEKRISVIGAYAKIILITILAYAVAEIFIDITDPFFHSKYYLSIFLKYLRGE